MSRRVSRVGTATAAIVISFAGPMASEVRAQEPADEYDRHMTHDEIRPEINARFNTLDDAGYTVGAKFAPSRVDVHGRIKVGEEEVISLANPEVAVAAEHEVVPWSTEIYYPGASYIAPHFKDFKLPPGARLVVRAPDGSRSWSYSDSGKEGIPAGEGFWGIHIPGDTAVLELYTTVPVPTGAVVVDKFARGFDESEWLSSSEPEPRAICGADDSRWARCYQSSEPAIYNKSRAVARLLIQGTGGCTGWLVGSAGNVMTNQHCIQNASDAANTDYEFMAEGACTQNCASPGACPGTVVATSATLVRVNSSLDYTLVKLPTNPTGTYGYLKMRTNGACVDERIYIPGHPERWGKRIAVESSHSSDQSGFCEIQSLNAQPCTGGPGDVSYFCDTRGGSSGSPVLAYSNHAVVSLHHCGACPNRGLRIQAVINNLGSDLPPNSTVGGTCGGGGGPPVPSELIVTNEHCWGLNTADWTSSPGATRYELYRSPYSDFRTQTLEYSGTATFKTVNVSSTTYLRVRACNATTCSGYRNGNQPATYFNGCL